MFRGHGDLEPDEVLAGVGIEIRPVFADLAADLASGALFGAPEQDIVLEDVDQAPRLGGFIFDSDIDGQDGIEQRHILFLDKVDLEAVIQDELFGRRLGGPCRGNCRERGGGQQDGGCQGASLGGASHMFILPQPRPFGSSDWPGGAGCDKMTRQEVDMKTHRPAKILIVDDEKPIRDALRMVLEYEGFKILEAADADEAKSVLEDHVDVDVALVDVMLPGRDGLAVLSEIRQRPSAPEVIMISGHATVQTAVEATKRGAFEFLEKPLSTDRVLLTIRNALNQNILQRECIDLRRKAEKRHELIGEHPLMKQLWKEILKTAPTNATVLIHGESGTGKELVARAIHDIEPEVQGAVRPGQLRRHPRGAHRKRALRPRERFVHRGHRTQDRQVRAGRRRHALPR